MQIRKNRRQDRAINQGDPVVVCVTADTPYNSQDLTAEKIPISNCKPKNILPVASVEPLHLPRSSYLGICLNKKEKAFMGTTPPETMAGVITLSTKNTTHLFISFPDFNFSFLRSLLASLPESFSITSSFSSHWFLLSPSDPFVPIYL